MIYHLSLGHKHITTDGRCLVSFNKALVVFCKHQSGTKYETWACWRTPFCMPGNILVIQGQNLKRRHPAKMIPNFRGPGLVPRLQQKSAAHHFCWNKGKSSILFLLPSSPFSSHLPDSKCPLCKMMMKCSYWSNAHHLSRSFPVCESPFHVITIISSHCHHIANCVLCDCETSDSAKKKKKIHTKCHLPLCESFRNTWHFRHIFSLG